MKITAFLISLLLVSGYFLTLYNTSYEYKVINSLNPQVKFDNTYYTFDLPEEYNQIREDYNNPDTLVSWIKHDTIYIRFLGHI